MLDLSITTRLEDEREPVTSTPTMGTLLKMERFFGLDSAVQALAQTKLEHVAWLAWESRRAAGITVPTWEKFRDSLVDMTFDTDEAPLVDGGPPTS